MVKGVDRFEVWFQYNKVGNWRFASLLKAEIFAKKFVRNKPIIYDLLKDEIVHFDYDVSKYVGVKK